MAYTSAPAATIDHALKQRIDAQLCHSRYYKHGRLASDPEPYLGQSEPVVTYARRYKSSRFELSIVIPVYNQDAIIARTLKSVIANTSGLYELILVIDGCTDRSSEICVEVLNAIPMDSGLCQAVVITQSSPVFEAACDNIGFSVSDADFIIEIQADMQLHDPGYDGRLISALRKYPDLIGVSGRCSHPFHSVWGVGKLGEMIEHPLPDSIDRSKIYVSGTCNRGPLALRRSMLVELRFLDERNYYLLDSDHDLFARAYLQYGWRCGYVPVEVISILAEGSTRKPVNATDSSQGEMSLNERIRAMKEESCRHGFLRASRHLLNDVSTEVRDL